MFFFFEKGQSNNSIQKGSGTGVFLFKGGNLGSSSEKGDKKENLNKGELGNKTELNQVYVPKLGGYVKVSANIDKHHHNVKGADPVNLNISNSFGILQDFGNEEDVETLYEEFGLDNSPYENYMNQEEVTGGIMGLDTNMETVINDD